MEKPIEVVLGEMEHGGIAATKNTFRAERLRRRVESARKGAHEVRGASSTWLAQAVQEILFNEAGCQNQAHQVRLSPR